MSFKAATVNFESSEGKQRKWDRLEVKGATAAEGTNFNVNLP